MNESSIGWIRIFGLIILYIFIVGSFQLIGGLVIGEDLTRYDLTLSNEDRVVLSFFNMLGTFVLLWFFMKFVDKEAFVKLGFHMKYRSRDFLFGNGLGAVIMGGGLVLLLTIDEISIAEIGFEPTQFLYSILLFAMVALVEEALFRGYILKNFMLSFNKPLALLLSAILFSLAHGANPNIDLFSLFELFLAGILLGVSYLYTKNLWFPIALHFSWNFFQSLFGFNVSGQDFYSIIELNYSSSNLLNGGAFGFEGSIFAVISSILAILWIVYYYQKNPEKAIPEEAVAGIGRNPCSLP